MIFLAVAILNAIVALHLTIAFLLGLKGEREAVAAAENFSREENL